MSLLDRDEERAFLEYEKHQRELRDRVLALMPVLLKSLMGEPVHAPPSDIDAVDGLGRGRKVVDIADAAAARENKLKLQVFKKIDGMTGDRIAVLLQSEDPRERRMFKQVFDMYCEWKGNKA